MPPKKSTTKKQKQSINMPSEPPDIPPEGEQTGLVVELSSKKSKKTLDVPPRTQQAEPNNATQATKRSKAPAKPPTTPHGNDRNPVIPAEPRPFTKVPVKRGPKQNKEQPPKPNDVTQARTQLFQAISGAASSASNARPSVPLPPPLQTRRAAKAAAQALVDIAQEGQQAKVVEKPARPQPRPLPQGLRYSPDSDGGFNLPKRRGKVARALERYHAAQNPPTNPATPTMHPAPKDQHEVRALTVPTGNHVPATSQALPPPKPLPVAAQTTVQQARPTVPSASQNVPAPTQALPQSEPPPSTTQTAAQQARATAPSAPQKPPSVTSPGGRHYSGLFPSTTLAGPGVLPPGAVRIAARVRATSPVRDTSMLGLQSCGEASEDNRSERNDNRNATDGPKSSPQPIGYSSNPFEDHIIRLCIRHGLDPQADYQRMARAYRAAKKKRDAEEDASDGDGKGNSEAGGGASGGGGGDGGGGGGDGGDGGGGDGGDGGDDGSNTEVSDGEEDNEGSGGDDDDRFGPEDDTWLIDPDTDNAVAPCTYHFQTSQCGIRYYGPPPEFVGSNGEVERFTTYRWNHPGAPMTLQRIAGGFRVPRASIWQRADARREIDRQRAEHLAAGLIQPHNDDDDDSGSDYGVTQEELKMKGKPVDSDLERESDVDVDSPVKAADKGKGQEAPAKPLADKGKGRAEPAILLMSTKPEDGGKRGGATSTSAAGTGGRPSIAELATCDALGVKFHRNISDIALTYGRRPEVILARLGLAPAPTRHTNIWNAFQTLFALQAPEVPHDAEWLSKCNQAYKQALDGLTPEQKKAIEHAIFAELDGIAEDPERVRTPAARMKTAIDEARRMSSIERYTPDVVRFSVFIYTGSDSSARQLNCVVTPSTILKSALERHNIALQPLIDIASDLIRGEITLQQVENAAHQQNLSGSAQEPVDDGQTYQRELHEFTRRERLMFYRVSEEPKRALEKVEKLPAKDRGPMYRRISTTHILTEMNLFVPDGQQRRKSVPFGNWATIATSWRITLLCWPDDLSIWPGCPVNIKHLTTAHWQQLCVPFVEDPAHAVRIEAWSDEQKGYAPDSTQYGLIPLVKNVHGDILVNVFAGSTLIKRPRIRGAGTHATMPITISDRDSDEDDIELELVAPRITNTRTAYSTGDIIEDFDNTEDYADDINKIVDSAGDADSETVEHDGNILYRIRSVTPNAVPVEPVESYDEDYMYELDRLDREQQHRKTRDISPLPQHIGRKLVPSPGYIQVNPHIESRPMAGVLKRRRQDEDQPQYRRPKVVRIQPPPEEAPVREQRREEVARLQQLRGMPAPEPRRPHIPPLIFPPPSQLPAAHHNGVSTEAFYKAMGGPPPSGRPLEPRARAHQHVVAQPAQSRHPVKPRIPAHFDSDGADDLSTGPNMSTGSSPSARFNYQRELRDGQAGPSNECFMAKGQSKGKRRDL